MQMLEPSSAAWDKARAEDLQPSARLGRDAEPPQVSDPGQLVPPLPPRPSRRAGRAGTPESAPPEPDFHLILPGASPRGATLPAPAVARWPAALLQPPLRLGDSAKPPAPVLARRRNLRSDE